MDRHIGDYFSEFSEEGTGGNFHRVYALHENPQMKWEELSELAPSLPRAWYELSHLATRDRIDFVRDYFLQTIPYHLHAHTGLVSFFERLDDIGIFLTQQVTDQPFVARLVYSIHKDEGFFCGLPPATDEELAKLQECFADEMLPIDYLAFLRIHNGFCKQNDTGVMPVNKVKGLFDQLQSHLKEQAPLTASHGDLVDPTTLIPFYESYGLHCYQCFWAEWYPEQEMGNVYYSGIERSLSDPSKGAPSETLAFPTFLDWLAFYLEEIS